MNSSSHNAVILFTRYPTPGQTKTRLIPALGADGASGLQRQLTELVVARLRPAVIRGQFQLTVCHAGASCRSMRHWLGNGLGYEPQAGGDLGERMTRAIQIRFNQGARKVAVIGADCPALTAPILEQAFAALDSQPAVFGPARDGGYYLVALSRPRPELFQGIRWGESTVLHDSLRRSSQLGLSPALLPTLADIDRPEDLPQWESIRRETSTLTVIIPTLNEAASVGETLDGVISGQPAEIIVADGGSTDGTCDIARQRGARVLQVPRGRARQMNAAAAVASSELLIFLHADTWPPKGYASVIRDQLNHPVVAAGAFRFAVRDEFTGRALAECLVRLRCRCLKSPFGDQGLFLRRTFFDAVGGFADWPILEDVEIVRRLKRHGRVVIALPHAQTSGRRWQELGLWRTFWINQLVLAGYAFGFPKDRLAAFYRSTRHKA